MTIMSRPWIALDPQIVAANARAWRAFAGVPVRAVVKADGYGWGSAALVNALEGEVASFCVSDEAELRDLRRYTAAPAIVLGDVPLARLERVLRAGAGANIGTAAELDVAERHARRLGDALRVRVGLRLAAGWSGLSPAALRAFTPILARAGAHVEVWSHVSDWEHRSIQARLFRAAVQRLRSANVRVVDTDFASTFPLAADGAQGSHVRVGIGLFGATGGHPVSGVRCALRVVAPVTGVEYVPSALPVGYGARTVPSGSTLATARLGYADGLPQGLAGTGDILSVGMQYVIAHASRLDATRSHLIFLDETTDLDAFAAQAGCSPHELVTALGNAASANAARRRPR